MEQIKTAKQVMDAIESWSGSLKTFEDFLNPENSAKYAVSIFASLIDHLIYMKTRHSECDVAYTEEYILQRFKDLAGVWAKSKIETK